MSAAKAPAIDDMVAGTYRLRRLLGRGSAGEVWLATHTTLGENVALKLLTKWPSENGGDSAARFRFEAQVAARLARKTRHIVSVTDHGEGDSVAYLVMELLEGTTLETKLERCKTLPPEEVRLLVRQVARALEHAHAEGILHRDLKPSNLFLARDEDGQMLVKVLDFGIAHIMAGHRIKGAFATGEGLVFGTAGYMSPEQASAQAELDCQCDLWALATIAYEALSGHIPIDGSCPAALLSHTCAGPSVPFCTRRPDLPATVGAFFDRAFAEDSERRFASAADLTQAFEAAWEPVRPATRRVGGRLRQACATVIPVVVVLIVAAWAGAGWRGRGTVRAPPAAPTSGASAAVARAAEPSAPGPRLPENEPASNPAATSRAPKPPAAAPDGRLARPRAHGGVTPGLANRRTPVVPVERSAVL